jgi:class 3 adenylate cyclase
MAQPCAEDSNKKEGVRTTASSIWVDNELLDELNQRIGNEEEGIRRVSTWPIDRTFVYFDVSDFSRETAVRQAMIVNSIVRVVDDDSYWSITNAAYAKKDLEARICIGDGYIFVLRDPVCAVFFAAYLAFRVETLVANGRLPVEFHFRVGAHVGDVYCFWDPGRCDWNYIGDGINGGQRVLAAVGKETDDVVFLSGQVRQRLFTSKSNDSIQEMLKALHNRGRRADKHGRPWRVYEMNHTDFISSGYQFPIK